MAHGKSIELKKISGPVARALGALARSSVFQSRDGKTDYVRHQATGQIVNLSRLPKAKRRDCSRRNRKPGTRFSPAVVG